MKKHCFQLRGKWNLYSAVCTGAHVLHYWIITISLCLIFPVKFKQQKAKINPVNIDVELVLQTSSSLKIMYDFYFFFINRCFNFPLFRVSLRKAYFVFRVSFRNLYLSVSISLSMKKRHDKIICNGTLISTV